MHEYEKVEKFEETGWSSYKPYGLILVGWNNIQYSFNINNLQNIVHQIW